MLDGAGRAVEDQLGEDGAGHVGAGQLFENDGTLDVAHTHAAVVLADGDAEQPRRLQRVPRRLGELFGFVPVCGARRELPLGEVTRVLAQRHLIFGFDERLHEAGS